MSSTHNTSSPEPLRLGFVLAGAVTAGAFTAGVIDYILDALLRWQKQYEKEPNKVPKPNVVLDVITGASAGSITAAVTTIGLFTNRLRAVQDPSSSEASKNLLFDTWVNYALNPGQNIFEEITKIDDLRKDGLKSLINTSFIDRIMGGLKEVITQRPLVDLPACISPDLQLLMTMSNLRGIPIDVHLDRTKNVSHRMVYHKAFAHFVLGDKSLFQTQNYLKESTLHLDPSNPKHLELFFNSARASSAYPIGLRAVPFEGIDRKYVFDYMRDLFGKNENVESRIEEMYSFLATDGGITNNEPMVEALKLLKQKGDNYKMILVDPFSGCEDRGVKKEYSTQKDSIFDIVPQLYDTVRNQILFKESDLNSFFEPDRRKYMIWPTRYDKSGEQVSQAIACSALNGFAGFLNRDYRVHDYMLGRKNAQNFLRKYFHTSNYNSWSPQYLELLGSKNEMGEHTMPIIPDFLVEKKETINGKPIFSPSIKNQSLPEFPKISYEKNIPEISSRLKKRLDTIIEVSYKAYVSRCRKKETNLVLLSMNQKRWYHKVFVRLGEGILHLIMKSFGLKEFSRRIHAEVMSHLVRELSNKDMLVSKNKSIKD